MKIRQLRVEVMLMIGMDDLQPSFSLFSIINLLGVVQAIFFAILLFTLQKNTSKAHFYLAVFLVAYALAQLYEVLEDSKYLLIFPHLSSVFPPLVFTLGPLLLFYTKALTQKDFKFKPKYLLHFLPFVMLLLLLIPYFILSKSEKLQEITFEYQHPPHDFVISYIALFQVFIYLFFSIKLIRQYSKVLKSYFSSVEKVSLQWLISLLFALVIIWIVWLLNTTYDSNFLKYAEAASFTAFIYLLGFRGLHQPDIFKKMAAVADKYEVTVIEDIIPVKKYEKSGIPADTIEAALYNLRQQMEVAKAYKNNELTLPELANLIAIPTHHLSQLLNEHLQSNFYDYVNQYRIEEMKVELVNPKNAHLTILALALEAGFNSKAAFNKAFKKHTGVSSSEYKTKNC